MLQKQSNNPFQLLVLNGRNGIENLMTQLQKLLDRVYDHGCSPLIIVSLYSIHSYLLPLKNVVLGGNENYEERQMLEVESSTAMGMTTHLRKTKTKTHSHQPLPQYNTNNQTFYYCFPSHTNSTTRAHSCYSDSSFYLEYLSIYVKSNYHMLAMK